MVRLNRKEYLWDWKLEGDFIEGLLYICQWRLYPKRKSNWGLAQYFAFLGWVLVGSDYIWNLDIFLCHNFSMIEGCVGNSLMVQQLGLCALTTKGLGLIPGWGINIPQAMWHGQKKEKKRKKDHLSLKAKTETKKKQQNTISLWSWVCYIWKRSLPLPQALVWGRDR